MIFSFICIFRLWAETFDSVIPKVYKSLPPSLLSVSHPDSVSVGTFAFFSSLSKYNIYLKSTYSYHWLRLRLAES